MLDLALKPVHFIHIVCLVVSACKEQRVRIEPFVREQGKNDLEREGATIDEIAVEKVHVGGGRNAVDFKYVKEVVELACWQDKDERLVIFRFNAKCDV